MIRPVAAIVALAACVLIAGCGAPARVTAPPSPLPSTPAPPSSLATVTGSCVTGTYDVTSGQFYPMSSLTQGATGMTGGDTIAEAYQLTLTDTSASATAAVTGFAVVFYSAGQELTSDSETLDTPTYITPGQSLTWTESPWGTETAGQQEPSLGPFAAGEMGAVNTAATCQLLQWSPG
jgi:hypothetical protein